MAAGEEGVVSLFCHVSTVRTKENVYKFHQGRSKLRIRKKFSERVIRVWNKLFREVVESPSLKVFKRCMDWPLGIWFRGDCGGADGAMGCLKVGLDDHEDLFQR